MGAKIITILCSGVALGVYIPAILVDYKLKQNGVTAEVVVLESILRQEKQARINDNKRAFHQSFRVALTGQKMARDLWPSFDRNALEQLFDSWLRENRRDFIIFSGFWMSVIKEYQKNTGQQLNIDIVHMDAAISASWKQFEADTKVCNNIWLFKGDEKKLIYEIPVTAKGPVAYNDRLERFVIHGGGWGMGTYMSKIPELESREIPLDIIAYEVAETANPIPGNRYFMMDPDWIPWRKNQNNSHEFPPFGEICVDCGPVFKNQPEYHELFDIISVSKGIISKPGGATLMDSLSSATPIVMLDPFGDYEQKNAELWECLGFGTPYDKWKESGYSQDLLEGLHQNLLTVRGRQIDYVTDFLKRNFA